MNLKNLDMTLSGLKAAYQAGITPRQVWREFHRRWTEWDDPALFISLATEAQLEPLFRRLEEPSARGLPLFGVLFAVKDNLDWDVLPTTVGCPAFSSHPERSATVVEKLLAAGAVPVGKTNLDQFATGLVGTRSPYGVPRNALAPSYIPGGSSSGSASAVAAGLVAFSLGSDTAGSGRIPAAFQGLVGYKPTRGLISNRGLVPACKTLDCVSVFAPSVADARFVGQLLEGYDTEDPYSRPVLPSRTTRPHAPVIGVPLESQRGPLDESYREAYERTIEAWRRSGANVVEVDIGPLEEAGRLLYQGPWVAERLAAVESLWRTHREAIHPVTQKVLETGVTRTAVEAFQAAYRLEGLRRQAVPLWSAVDFLLLPTAPFFPTLAHVEADPLGVNSRLGTWTNFVNLLDLAAVALPGVAAGTLPFGITLMAPAGSDQALLEAAAAWEAIRAGSAPPVRTLGKTVLAVVGAHLRGLPLNGQLAERGARFLEEAQTAPRYRLYAFRDGNLDKPGLVRADTGASIALELWDLPEAAWGSFLALVPHPLGLGKIELSTGEWVTGFVMEAVHIAHGTEITSHGSWKSYLRRNS